jgi:hypothetical protein
VDGEQVAGLEKTAEKKNLIEVGDRESETLKNVFLRVFITRKYCLY